MSDSTFLVNDRSYTKAGLGRLHLGELPENNELPDAGSEDFEELAKTMEVLAGTDGCVRKKVRMMDNQV